MPHANNPTLVYPEITTPNPPTICGDHAVVINSAFNGIIEIKEYPKNENCFIDVVADQTCTSIEISYENFAMQPNLFNWCKKGYSTFYDDAHYYFDTSDWDKTCETIKDYKCHDWIWITTDSGEETDDRCGCNGNGCNLLLAEDDPDYYDDYKIYFDYHQYQMEKTSDIVSGNSFKLNMISDFAVQSGDLYITWRCVNSPDPETTVEPTDESTGTIKPLHVCTQESMEQSLREYTYTIIESEFNDTKNEKRLTRFNSWFQHVFDEFTKDYLIGGYVESPKKPALKMQTCMKANFESMAENLIACEFDIPEPWTIEKYCDFAQQTLNKAYAGCVVNKRNGRTLRLLKKRCDRLIEIK